MVLRARNNILNKNIVWHKHIVQQKDRESLHKHRSMVLWFTGLSGSGKSTIASCLEQELHFRSISTYLLDGDNIRHGLCRDLEFTDYDRYKNLQRVGEVASLMVDAGLVVLAAFISPYYLERQMVRNIFPLGSFIEVFVDTPLSICEDRDPKGLYKMSRLGIIKNFVGIHTVYEKPRYPEIYLDGRKLVKDLVDELLEMLIGTLIKFSD